MNKLFIILGLLAQSVFSPSTLNASRLFNGTNQSASTSSAIDLSAFNKATIVFNMTIVAFNSVDIFIELTTDGGANSGGFAFYRDTIPRFYAGCSGSSGYNYKGYDATPFTTGTNHHVTISYDFSTNPTATSLWVDGVLQTPVITNLFNNSNNFANAILYMGARNNSALWSNCKISQLAIYGGIVLGSDDINALSKGLTPLKVRPSSLVHFWPLEDFFQDIRGGVAITNNGSTVSDNPRIYK